MNLTTIIVACIVGAVALTLFDKMDPAMCGDIITSSLSLALGRAAGRRMRSTPPPLPLPTGPADKDGAQKASSGLPVAIHTGSEEDPPKNQPKDGCHR